ncbi:hypothetical protein BO221_40610 [Archangium sp. Cb G35]|nr:hypothetical protein BO221_40610 [Archangium sp. Cb G35]
MMLERWDADREGALSEAAPRTVFDFHAHGVGELDAVLSGRFRLTMAGRSVVLDAGDVLYVPAGVLHRAVLSFDGVKR